MELSRRLLYAILLLFCIIAVSVAGYMALGGPSVSLLQALYMAVITLAGVGYGEIVDTSHNPALRIFNMFVVLVGVTFTVYVLSSVTAFLVEGDIRDLFWRRKMQKRISELKNHTIVCGLGDTGRYAVEEFHKTTTPYVVVEADEDSIQRFRSHDRFRDLLYVIGDATDETVLDKAGLGKAKCLVAGVAEDKDNLVITVVARQKCPEIRIVSRCIDTKFSERMIKAGANATVSPNQIGGLRIASEALRPHVVSFLDLMLREQSRTLRIDEIEVPASSAWAGQTLEKLKLRMRYKIMPLAIKEDEAAEIEHRFLINPPDNHIVKGGAVIIVMGDVEDVRRAREDAQHQQVFAATT